MNRVLILTGLLFLISGVVLSTNVLAEGKETAKAADALAKDFPKMEFQSIEATGVAGWYEVVAGMNVLYYNPKNNVLFFGELFSKDWKNRTAGTRGKLLAASFREARFDQEKGGSSTAGLHEILSGQQVIYFDPKSGARMIGEMYTKDGKNLTVEARDKAAAKTVLRELPLGKAIKIGTGRSTVIMFTDPDCPYCRKLEDYFRDRKDVTRYVYLLPLEQIHPKSAEKSTSILCSRDKPKAFLDAMAGSLDSGAITPCSDPKVADSLNEMKSMAQRLGIQGTPYLIVNGVTVRGADTKRIDELLSAEGR